MNKKWWRCTICGYIYKPEVGNPAAGVPPNTPFEDLSEEWVCPVCFHEKSYFIPFLPEQE